MPDLVTDKTVEQIVKEMPYVQQGRARNLYLRGRDDGWQVCIAELEEFIRNFPAETLEALWEGMEMFIKQSKERQDI